MNDFAALGGAADLELSPGEIQIWAVALDPPPPVAQALAGTLAADERERAARFRFERHRRQYEVGRGALRTLLGGYLGLSPTEIRFAYGERGKPFLAAPPSGGHDLHFNLSNSNELALVGFVRGVEIGVDVEYLKPMPDLEQIAERFFSASERVALRQLPAPLKPEGFFNCWTRKEAYLKAVGEGLAARLDSFDVTLVPGDAPRMLTLEGDAARAARWFLKPFRPAPEYIGALAVESAALPVRTFRFTPAA
jgi:4'-phosphopantetheinyl transferase